LDFRHWNKNFNNWKYLDNGQIRIGIKKISGGAIGWLSRSGSEQNVLNHWDHGRLIQQSYYGNKDGSLWNGKPWRWNPVQGGDWKGNPAKILKLQVQKNRIYVKTLPKHWASGADLKETEMEQWLQLEGNVAHIHYKMTYRGKIAHVKRHHEIPAVFVNPEYDTLVLYDGEQPWSGGPLSRSKPGWPNEKRTITEHWAAYVNRKDWGVGVLVPKSDSLTCYRFGKPDQKGACSYFAPLARFAITPGTVFEYDVYLTLGTSAEIRRVFKNIMEKIK